MADHADGALLALQELDHVLGGLGGGGLVVRLDGGDGDVGLNTGVEGDDRDTLLVDLVQQVGGSLRVESGEADGGRAGVQSGLQLVGLLGHLGLAPAGRRT